MVAQVSFVTLAATADYTIPVIGLDSLLERAHQLGAKVTLDTDQGKARVQVTLTTGDTDLMSLAASLVSITEILPAEAIVQTSSWRITGEPPF